MASSFAKRRMAPEGNMKARGETVFIAQQLHFANTLAGNDPKHRARAMKKLRKYFLARANGNFCFTYDDFMRIWKGLFYCMWMSDKPLIQEELAEEISQLVHCFQDVGMALIFVQAFFDTLMVEWFGIDYHRMDKFQMFVRRFLRQCLTYCKNENWKKVPVTGLCEVFESTILSPSKCVNECDDISLIMHFSDVFVEELAKVGRGQLSEEIILDFLRPFMSNLAGHDDFRLQDVIRDKVFFCLIKQSPEGLEYEEKFEAWKRAGFPGTSWEEMVFVGKEDNRSGVKIKNLDPRAGRVNVYLPHLKFDAGSVAKMLREYAEKSLNRKCQRCIQNIANKFQRLAGGSYPLAINLSKTLLDSSKYRFSKQKIDDAVEDLLDFEEQLKKNNKRKKNSSDLNKPKKIKLENNYVAIDASCENIGNEEILCDNGNLEENLDDDRTFAGKDETEDSDPSMLQNGEIVHENTGTSSTVEGSYKMDKESTRGDEVDNSHSTKMKGKEKHITSSWSISEISSLQEKVPQEGDWEESKIACEELDTLGQAKEVTTPLRRSTRRRSSVVSTPNKSNEVEFRHETKLSNENVQTLLPKRKSLTPRSIIRGKGRISTVPDREIPNIYETGEISDSINIMTNISDSSALSPINETCNGVLRNNNMLNKQEESLPSSPQDFQTPGNKFAKKRVSLHSTPTSNKKVNIVLQMNKSQAVSEYVAAVKQSPSVPHDANKMPCKGVLKRTSIKSPINPFYVPPKGLK